MKILFQGDSITDVNRNETMDNLGLGYVRIIKNTLNDYEIINKGISGNRTRDLIKRWEEDTINIKPDILVILIGINDIWHKYEHNVDTNTLEFRNNYLKLLNDCLERIPNTKIVLIEPFVFPIGAYNKTWERDLLEQQKIVKELALKYNHLFVPMQEILNKNLDEYEMIEILNDGVHPTKKGHEIIAKTVLVALNSLISD